MTEKTSPWPPFPAEYPAPADQLSLERQMHLDYESQFPASAQLLTAALNDLKRGIGLNIPKYSKVESIDGSDVPDGLTDARGYLTLAGPPLYARISLTMPKRHTPKQIRAMNDAEQRLAGLTSDGMAIAGDMPAETYTLLENLYRLTGSRVILNEREEGEAEGTVLREGVYLGKKVWIAENYTDNDPYFEGQDTLTVRVVSEDYARAAQEGLTMSQRMALHQLGVNGYDAYQRLGITRQNFQQTISVLHATKAAIDGATNEADEGRANPSNR